MCCKMAAAPRPKALKTHKGRSTPRTPTRQLLTGPALASCVPLEKEEEGWPLGGLLGRRQQVHTAGLQAGCRHRHRQQAVCQ